MIQGYENWRSLTRFGFDDYSIRADGAVKSHKTDRILKPSVNQEGNLFVRLYGRDGKKQVSVARLVLRVFNGEPQHHTWAPLYKDLDHSNVAIHNLAWRPRQYIRRYAIERARRPLSRPKMVIKCINTGQYFESVREASTHYGVTDADLLSAVDEEYHNSVYLRRIKLTQVTPVKKTRPIIEE